MSVYYFGKSQELIKFGALELPAFKVENNIEWVINGINKPWRNLQPQYYSFLYQTSTKHHAIVNAKSRYTYGKGWAVDPLGLNPTSDMIELYSFLRKIEKSQVTQRCILDRIIQGGFCAEMIYDNAGAKVYPYHIDFGNVRESKPEYEKDGKTLKPKLYFYTTDWKKQDPKNNADFTIFHPFDPDEKQDKSKRYLVYYKDYRPDLGAYPYPEYMGGLPYIQADAEVGNFVYNNVKQGFTSGYIFNFFQDLSEEQRGQVEKMLKATKHGSENAGDPFVAFNKPGDKGVEVTPIQANGQDERYLQLNNQIRDEIFTAHAVSPLVVGMKGDNGFSNNADEIRTAVENFTEGYVKSSQDIFNEFMNAIIDFNEIKGDVYLERLDPIKPQVTESILMAIADKKTIAKYYGIELPKETVTKTVIEEKQFDSVSAHIGIKDEDIEVLFSQEHRFESIEDALSKQAELRQTFTSGLEKSILGALQDNPKLTAKELSELLKSPKSAITKALKSLDSQGLLNDGVLTPDGETEIEEFKVVYKYVTRNDVPPVETESRDFCKRYMKLSQTRSFTIEDIQLLSALEGYDVFAKRGGWYHNPETDKTTDYCRHIWQQSLIRMK